MKDKQDKPIPMSRYQAFEETTDEILQRAAVIRAERKKQYGGMIFHQTAKIATSIGLKKYEPMDVHIIFLAMKLARYRHQLYLQDAEIDEYEGLHEEAVSIDSANDGIVYLALMEAERCTSRGYKPKRKTRSSPESISLGKRFSHKE